MFCVMQAQPTSAYVVFFAAARDLQGVLTKKLRRLLCHTPNAPCARQPTTPSRGYASTIPHSRDAKRSTARIRSKHANAGYFPRARPSPAVLRFSVKGGPTIGLPTRMNADGKESLARPGRRHGDRRARSGKGLACGFGLAGYAGVFDRGQWGAILVTAVRSCPQWRWEPCKLGCAAVLSSSYEHSRPASVPCAARRKESARHITLAKDRRPMAF